MIAEVTDARLTVYMWLESFLIIVMMHSINTQFSLTLTCHSDGSNEWRLTCRRERNPVYAKTGGDYEGNVSSIKDHRQHPAGKQVL